MLDFAIIAPGVPGQPPGVGVGVPVGVGVTLGSTVGVGVPSITAAVGVPPGTIGMIAPQATSPLQQAPTSPDIPSNEQRVNS